MHGHQWEAAEGRIVDVVSRRHEHTYTIEVRRPTGALIRRPVRHKSPTAYPVGSTVRVEIDQNNEMRFPADGDPLISTMTMADQIAEASAAFDAPGTHGPSFDTPGIFGGGSRTVYVTSERVIGPGGTHVQIDPSELTQLAQALMSGDFGAHSAQPDTAESRLAKLQHLLDTGVVTQSEYEIQRQRIIGEI